MNAGGFKGLVFRGHTIRSNRKKVKGQWEDSKGLEGQILFLYMNFTYQSVPQESGVQILHLLVTQVESVYSALWSRPGRKAEHPVQ